MLQSSFNCTDKLQVIANFNSQNMVWSEICNWQLVIHSKFCLTIHVLMSTSILTFNRSYQIWIDKTMFWSQHPCWEVMFWSEHPYCQSMCQSQHPYSQLTDDSKFYLTSNDLISTFLLATTVTCFQILHVTKKSCPYVEFCLTNNALKIYQTQKTAFHTFPNTKNRVENKMGSGEFLTNFEVFENVVKGYPTFADVTFSNSLINSSH